MQETIKKTAAGLIGKQEQCYATIRQRIVSGIYGPGHRLVLGNLAEEFKMSSVPVREAIRRLEAEGLVTYRRNVGAQVTPLTQESLHDLMQAHAVLESSATALAAPLITAQTIIHLRQLNTAIESTLEEFDFRGYMNCNLQFHQAIVETCPNAYLKELWRTTSERIHALRGLMASWFPDRARQAFEEHKKLIRLIEEKARPEIIERFARSHIESTFERFFENRSG
jgi:DNA-binding GntR family transcriptional regulator